MINKPMAAESVHWSRQKEQTAGYWQVKFLLILFKLLPVVIVRLLAFPVGFFYFIFSKRARESSKLFLKKVSVYAQNSKIKKMCLSPFGPLRNIISFSLTLIEKIQTWSGKFPFKNLFFRDDDVVNLIKELENGKGAFIITSHLGNVELLRGLVNQNKTGVSRKIPVTVIGDTRVTGNFTEMLQELNPESMIDIINAEDTGPHTAVLLEEKLLKGGMIMAAGDRTSPENKNNLFFPFLGEEAPFSPGIFYLSVLMKAPVYFIFALRRKDLSINPKYDMFVHKSSVSAGSSRKERQLQSSELAKNFAEFMENYCKIKPFQWYNFYDFWVKEV